jgi:hypothetical protein
MKEMIKSLLLISLTISAIVLTGAVFMRDTTEVVVASPAYETEDLIELLRPQNYIFSFGDSFIKIYEDSYEGISLRRNYEQIFKAFFDASPNISPSPIDKTIWDENIKRRSIQVNYPVDLSLQDLLEVNGYEVEAEKGVSVHVTSVLFLLNIKDAIYIHDGKLDTYYKLSSSEPSQWIDELFSSVDDVKKEEDTYLPLESRYALLETGLREYNIAKENLLLTPMNNNVYYPKYQITNEVADAGKSKNLELVAEKVFNQDLSFVKKSVYSDNEVLYMYGYGEKVFRYNSDGSIEYTEKISDNASKESIDFVKGLSIFKDKISKFGVISTSMYLSGYEQIESENAIETIYYFNYTKKGIPYYNDKMRGGHLIEIRFINTEFSKLKKYIRIANFEGYNYTHEERGFKQIMLENRIQIELGYEKDRPLTTVSKDDIYQMSLHEMSEIEVRYMIIDDRLIPTWYITIADTDYVIDLSTRKIISIDGRMIE